MTNHVIVSDLDIQALVDEELEGEARKLVEGAVKVNYTLQNRYNQLLRQKHMIARLWSCNEGENLH